MRRSLYGVCRRIRGSSPGTGSIPECSTRTNIHPRKERIMNMTPKEIEKLFNHPAELSAKTDGKGNGQVALRGEVADLGWLVNKVVTGIYAQVDDPDTVRALDAAITMTIHLRATKRVKELQATGMTFPMKVDAAPAPDGGTWGSIFGALFGK